MPAPPPVRQTPWTSDIDGSGHALNLDDHSKIQADGNGNMTQAGESLSLNIIGAIGTPNATLDDGHGTATLVGVIISGSRLSIQNIPAAPGAPGDVYSNNGVLTVS